MLESWSRHTLVRIHDLLDEGIRRNHADWTGRAYSLGQDVELQLPGGTEAGKFTGLDEFGGALLQSGGETRLIPLTAMLEDV